MEGLRYAMQKARSIVQENIELHSPDPVDADLLEEVARYHSPWLFSEDGKQWLELVGSLCQDATPIDVMNVAAYMGLTESDRRREPRPGNDLALQLLFSRLSSYLVRDPCADLTLEEEESYGELQQLYVLAIQSRRNRRDLPSCVYGSAGGGGIHGRFSKFGLGRRPSHWLPYLVA